MDDPVNHPAHYTQYPHEVIELTEQLNFCMGNAVKYILRAPFKGREAEDLKKAKWYVERARKTDCFEIFDDEDEAFYELVDSFRNDLLSTLVDAAVDAVSLTGSLNPNGYEAFIAKLDLAIQLAEAKAERKALEDENRRLRSQILLERTNQINTTEAFPALFKFGDFSTIPKFTCIVR